jgi:tetratricopeptide (TPR) repeat protein
VSEADALHFVAQKNAETTTDPLRVFVPSWLTLTAWVLLLVASGCSPSRREPSRATLTPVVLPDLSRMERPVQEQMRQAYASLVKKRDDASTPEGVLASAFGEMGNLLLAAEYLDAAEPCYLNAQALSPDDMQWPYYLGHLYRTRGESQKAAAAFERAHDLAPLDLASLVWLGNVYLEQGHAEAAEALFATAVSLQPQSVAALVGKGRAALANREFSRAAENFERALVIDPRASMVHYPLALAYRGLGEMDRADAHLRRRGDVEVGPADPLMQAFAGLLHSAVSYETRGIRALDSGDWATAEASFRKAIELAPDNASLHHRLGTALSQTGDTRGAMDEFGEAIRRSPGYAPSYFSLGVLLASSGHDSEAIERFSAAVRHEPGYADARLQLAGALIRMKRYGEAHAQLVEGTKHNPERPEFARALEQFQVR